MSRGRQPSTVGNGRCRRLLHLLRVLVRHALINGLAPRLSHIRWLATFLPIDPRPEPERLRALFEELGGTFLKLGQMLALQPDVLPAEHCRALFDLLDRVPPVSTEEIETTLRDELGRPLNQAFEAFDRQPLAAASIGQVHLARYRGHKVAVKVQRPDAERQFLGDLRWMKLARYLIRGFRIRRLEPMVEPMDELIDWIREELDFRREAHYMQALGGGADGSPEEDPIPHQHIPEVFVATRKLLIMEFLEGVTVLQYLRARDSGDPRVLEGLRQSGFQPERFAGHIIENFLCQVYLRGLFHADLHPANLMILPGDVVGYFDFGITGGLSAFSRRSLVAMTLAYARGDLDALSSSFSQVSHADAVGSEAYRQGLHRLGERWFDRRAGEVRMRKSFTFVMLEMLQLSRETGVWAQRDVIKYIRSAVALDGLVCRLAPGLDLIAHLEQACARHLTGRLEIGPATEWSTLGRSLAGLSAIAEVGSRMTTVAERLARGDMRIHAQIERGAIDDSEVTSRRGHNRLAEAGLLAALASAAVLTDLGLLAVSAMIATACARQLSVPHHRQPDTREMS